MDLIEQPKLFLKLFLTLLLSELKTVHLQGFWPKPCISSGMEPNKNRVSSRLLAKNRVSQVFWEPIKNRVSPRSTLLEAVYLEALLYLAQ